MNCINCNQLTDHKYCSEYCNNEINRARRSKEELIKMKLDIMLSRVFDNSSPKAYNQLLKLV